MDWRSDRVTAIAPRASPRAARRARSRRRARCSFFLPSERAHAARKRLLEDDRALDRAPYGKPPDLIAAFDGNDAPVCRERLHRIALVEIEVKRLELVHGLVGHYSSAPIISTGKSVTALTKATMTRIIMTVSSICAPRAERRAGDGEPIKGAAPLA